MVFLYGPGVHLQPAGIKETKSAPFILRNSEYAIGKDKKTLTIGDTIVLAAYRELGESLCPLDIDDAESIKRIIQEDSTVLLLKLKVETRNDKSIRE
jgi:dTDP-D-glucose 4,6-dehydratase